MSYAPSQTRTRVYLPHIHGNGPMVAGETSEFVRLWQAELGDRAAVMVQDDRLMRCAADHAAYLHSRTEAQIDALAGVPHGMHVGRDGLRPNARLRQFGVLLPWWWEDGGNQVEACARTHRGPARALVLWLNSAAHRPLLLHEGWYEKHILWGFANVGDDYVYQACPVVE
jgi:hypothetical protein